MPRIAGDLRSQGIKDEDEIARKVNAAIVNFKEQRYQDLRGQFEDALRPLRVVDGIGIVLSLGVESERKVTAKGSILLAPVEAGQE